MTEALCAAERCDRPVRDAYLCTGCADTLRAALRSVALLEGQLRVTVTRRDRIGAAAGGRRSSDEQPLPVNLAASDADHHLRTLLVGWVRDLADTYGETYGAPEQRPLHGPACDRCAHDSCRRMARARLAADTMAAMALWLADRTARLRVHPAADELHAGLTAAIRAAWRAVDRSAEKTFAGWCEQCGTDLYARPGAAQAVCHTCKDTYDVDQQRKWMLAEAADHLGTATEVVRAVTALRGRVTASTLRTWVARGRLLAHRGADGVTRYRVGDVAGLVRQTEETREARV